MPRLFVFISYLSFLSFLSFLSLFLTSCAHQNYDNGNGNNRIHDSKRTMAVSREQETADVKVEKKRKRFVRHIYSEEQIRAFVNEENSKDDLQIKIPLQKEVLHELKRMLGPHRRSYLHYQHVGEQYRAMMENELKMAGVPVELRAIPLVESGFRIIKRGPGGVAGQWCFTASTARHLGLTPQERLQPQKLSSAAAKLLKDLYLQFAEDWTWTLLAYNRGAYGMEALKKRLESKNLKTFNEQWPHYPRAGRHYLARVYAAILLIRRPELLER